MLNELWTDAIAWWAALSPEFQLLVALPFAVAAAAVAADSVRKHAGAPRARSAEVPQRDGVQGVLRSGRSRPGRPAVRH